MQGGNGSMKNSEEIYFKHTCACHIFVSGVGQNNTKAKFEANHRIRRHYQSLCHFARRHSSI